MICPICGNEINQPMEMFLQKRKFSIDFEVVKEIVLYLLKNNSSIMAAKFLKEAYGCGLGDAVRMRNIIKFKYT